MDDVALGDLRGMVRSLRPGGYLAIPRHLLRRVPCPPPWNAAEWILEGIVGSAYEFCIIDTPESGGVVFRRLAEPLSAETGLRAYVSADRKHFFRRRPLDLLYERAR